MENKFKEGDLVECIEVVGCDLELGNKYEVESVGDFHIGVTKDGKFVGQYKKRRFKLAKQEQESNYMYVWDVSEKDAIKLDVFADLSTNPRRTNNYPIVALDERGVICAFMHCKTIKQWEADNKPKPKYRPFTQEEFRQHRDKWLKHIQGSTHEYRVNRTEDDYIFVGDSRCTYRDLLDSFTFEDGTPCGVKE